MTTGYCRDCIRQTPQNPGEMKMFSFSPGVPQGEHFSSTTELSECVHVPEAGATIKKGVRECS